MTVKDIISKMENGACHIVLISDETGEVYLSTIWHQNDIDEKYLKMKVVHICVRDYEMRLTIV